MHLHAAPATSSTARRSTRRSGTRSSATDADEVHGRRTATLNVTTVAGDIYTNGDPAATRNFLLQTADHAKADWVLETKVDATQLNGGYAQGGILVRTDDDNYVKFDAISDDNSTTFNRIELRSEQAGAIQNPQPQLTPAARPATTAPSGCG